MRSRLKNLLLNLGVPLLITICGGLVGLLAVIDRIMSRWDSRRRKTWLDD